jgi:hypothetical protein
MLICSGSTSPPASSPYTRRCSAWPAVRFSGWAGSHPAGSRRDRRARAPSAGRCRDQPCELQDRRGKGLDLLRGRAAWYEELRCHVAAASLHALETAGYRSLPCFCMFSTVQLSVDDRSEVETEPPPHYPEALSSRPQSLEKRLRRTLFVRGQAASRLGARSTACRSASSRLRSSAIPLPAMSNAVP